LARDVIFLELSASFLRFSRKRQDGSAQDFFQGLGQNTCSIQSALKSIAPDLKSRQEIMLIIAKRSRIFLSQVKQLLSIYFLGYEPDM